LGVSIITKQNRNSSTILSQKNWVAAVEADSPANEAGVRPIQLLESGVIRWGDAIVAVGGKEVATFVELRAELDVRIKGEQVALTLEDSEGERRVVYVTLLQKPS
jgi:S1-C subfamily serine protease